MSVEQDKATLRRLVEEGLNKRNYALLSQFSNSDAVEHAAPPGLPQNIEGTKQYFGMFEKAFPDYKYKVEDTIAEGDTVVQRVKAEGTMKGEFLGMQPTGKHAVWDEIHVVRMRNGKIQEHWANVDQAGMLAQLGIPRGPEVSH